MLKQIVTAQIPLIHVHTTDLVNVRQVIAHLIGKEPIAWGTKKGPPGSVFYTVHVKGTDYTPLYDQLSTSEQSLIILNMDNPDPAVFEGGEMPVPKEMLRDFLVEVIGQHEGKIASAMRALGGVTLKEAAELCLLTMSRDGALTASGIMLTRQEFFQAQPGLTLVNSQQPFYLPDPMLGDWLERERSFFLTEHDPRLVPRGLLFDGPPGVGKTSGAKFIAETWGVPLYRVDIGATKNKYVGESERFMMQNLARLDREEPCIALFDEVEKIFGTGDHSDAGTTASMMSQLLWWLAERRSKVLVVMTTNAAKKLPPELHREGRIDKTMIFGGLPQADALAFIQRVVKTFNTQLNDGELKHALAHAAAAGALPDKTYSHAALTTAAYRAVKDRLLKPIGSKVA